MKDSSDPLVVKASFYPLQYLVEQIGGDLVSVDSLTPPGTDAHSLELSPKTVS
ncbi:zinc ABC transporter substrate-binding protein, partial [Gleimia europaea]|nr:zinc ABC transporter substrate-binding protein [Gleimia europaea]